MSLRKSCRTQKEQSSVSLPHSTSLKEKTGLNKTLLMMTIKARQRTKQRISISLLTVSQLTNPKIHWPDSPTHARPLSMRATAICSWWFFLPSLLTISLHVLKQTVYALKNQTITCFRLILPSEPVLPVRVLVASLV